MIGLILSIVGIILLIVVGGLIGFSAARMVRITQASNYPPVEPRRLEISQKMTEDDNSFAVRKENLEREYQNKYAEYTQIKRYVKSAKRFVYQMVALGILMVIAQFFTWSSWEQVDQTEVAVITEFGKVKGMTNATGLVDKGPFERYVFYDKRIRTFTVTREFYSAAPIQAVTLEFAVDYQIDPTSVVDLYQRYGSLESLETKLAFTINSEVEKVTGQFTAQEFTTNKQQFIDAVKTALSGAFDVYYIEITNIRLVDTVYTAEYESLLQETLLAQQQILKQQAELEKQLQEATYKVQIAEQKALEDLAKAQGEANAILAKAQAEADGLLAKSLAEAQGIEAIGKATALANSAALAGIAQGMGFTVTVTDDGYRVETSGHTADEIKLLADTFAKVEYYASWNGQLPNIITDGSGIILVP